MEPEQQVELVVEGEETEKVEEEEKADVEPTKVSGGRETEQQVVEGGGQNSRWWREGDRTAGGGGRGTEQQVVEGGGQNSGCL